MIDKIKKLKSCYNELFGFYDNSFLDSCFVKEVGGTYVHNCLIEIEDGKDALTLSANKEGMLYIIWKLLDLCEHDNDWYHYHLDEAGMASKCNKPIIIHLARDVNPSE